MIWGDAEERSVGWSVMRAELREKGLSELKFTTDRQEANVMEMGQHEEEVEVLASRYTYNIVIPEIGHHHY